MGAVAAQILVVMHWLDDRFDNRASLTLPKTCRV